MSRSKGRVKDGVKGRVKIGRQRQEQDHKGSHTIAWTHPVDLRAFALDRNHDRPALPGRGSVRGARC